MQEYLYGGTSENECRDLLREIDAGELDERYLIKHAGDYGRHAATHPLNVLKAAIANLLTRAMQSSQPKQIVKQVKTFSRPATQ